MASRVCGAFAGILLGVAAATTLASAGALAQGQAQAAQPASNDRHASYYYPPPQTRETIRSIAVTLADSDRSRRLGFVTAMTQQMVNNPYPPPFAIFAKGDDGEKLIIVSLTDGSYDTLYRARALFANLTAMSRLTPFFQEHAVEDIFTFFDLCKLLGFTQVTWSDGKTLSHQIFIK